MECWLLVFWTLKMKNNMVMGKNLFLICNLKIIVLGQIFQMIDNSWYQFETSEVSELEITIHILEKQSLDYQLERYEIQGKNNLLFRYNSDIIVASCDWSYCILLELHDSTNFSVFTNHIFYSRAIYHKMIQCHSSLVDWNGSGILFLGPSGIGKTTQAERWAEYRGADIVNGDLVFVQQTDDGFLGWGTSWHGSSPYCINRAVPLKALVVLKQSKENRIQELTGFEKVSEVSNNVFYPTWLDDGMEICMEILNNLLLQLPVYRLDNRADVEAVEILEQEIKRIDE